MPNDVLVSLKTRVFSWEGSDMAKRQIRGTRRARVLKCKKLLEGILADDAKPAAKTAKLPKIIILDDTVSFTATDDLTDFANNLISRFDGVLALV